MSVALLAVGRVARGDHRAQRIRPFAATQIVELVAWVGCLVQRLGFAVGHTPLPSAEPRTKNREPGSRQGPGATHLSAITSGRSLHWERHFSAPGRCVAPRRRDFDIALTENQEPCIDASDHIRYNKSAAVIIPI